MPRLLIFCGSRTAVEKYDAANTPGMPGQFLIYTPPTREYALQRFRADPDAIMVGTVYMAHGWHAPMGTFVTFDASWNQPADSAYTLQAKARVPGRDPAGWDMWLTHYMGRKAAQYYQGGGAIKFNSYGWLREYL